mgnify:CR=1 FL=1
MKLLETASTTYKLTKDGYSRKTPIILKYIADSILVLIPIVDGILLQAPDFEAKLLVSFIWSTFGVLFKFVTKFISEFPKVNTDGE